MDEISPIFVVALLAIYMLVGMPLGWWFVFPRYVRPWTFKIERNGAVIRFEYLALTRYDTVMACVSVVALCLCVPFLIASPSSEETVVVLIFGMSFLVFGILFLLARLRTRTVVTITDGYIEYRQGIRYLLIGNNLVRRGKVISSTILRIYNERRIHKRGEQFLVYVDTTKNFRQLLLDNIFDEDVAVTIKDEIILRNKLVWSSELG